MAAHREVVAHVVLEAKVDLVRVCVLKILCYRKSEGLNDQRRAGSQVVLVDKDRIRQPGIESLLIRQITHVRDGGADTVRIIHRTLEDVGGIQIEWAWFAVGRIAVGATEG